MRRRFSCGRISPTRCAAPLRVAVDVAIKAGDTLHAVISFGFPIGSGVELLLRKLRDQQAQPVELLRIQNAIEQIVEVVDGDQLSFGNITEIRARRQENRRRKLRQKVFRNVKVHVEAFQPRLLLDVHLGERSCRRQDG